MDPIADMLIRIKNGYLAKKEFIEIPFSKIKEKISEILVGNGYAKNYEIIKDNKIAKSIKLILKYEKNIPGVSDVERVSKPGLRVYKGKNKLPRVLGGLGIAIISTSKGLMTEKESNKKGLGGEIICKIW